MIPVESIPAMQEWVYDFTSKQLPITGVDPRHKVYESVEFYTALGAMRYCSDVLDNKQPSLELLQSLEDRISVARMTILIVNYSRPDKKK